VRRLVTIPISHYCEKARWALERAGLEYVEERHVQGVHRVAARRAGGGRTVPVLIAPEGVLGESREVIEYADARVEPERRLFPGEPDLRREVGALCAWLDDDLGPAGRRLMYSHMLDQRRVMFPVNCDGVPRWERWALGALWPVGARWVARELGIGPETPGEDERRVWAAFDVIGERLGDGRRYLFGDRFTAADLTFASLAAPAVAPSEYTVPLPELPDLAEHTADLVRRFRAHPAGAFALRMFRDQRR
jgi:glutathione S-transferase